MPLPSFQEWLKNRPEEAPAAEKLATLIAGAGAAGISRDGLARALGLPPETLEDLLRALTATGQVEVVQVKGQKTYRAVT
jgi:predicted ArsR family transcriptional regulator